MATKQVGIAELIGVPAESIEGAFNIRIPEEPGQAQRTHDRDVLALKLTSGVVIAAMIFAFALSCLFLYYEKPDQAEKVVATIIGLIGGIGIGRTTTSRD